MDYYHDLVTQKSWQLLQNLRRKYNFILIGGWAVFLHTGALKSKDIDLVMEYNELEKLRQEFSVIKNNRLKKYEARSEEVEIDVYSPFYSNPGLPAEDLKNYVLGLGGFNVADKEALAVLKERALRERAASAKGRKDLIDLVSLFNLGDFDWRAYEIIVKQYELQDLSKFALKVILQTTAIDELNLNPHKMARLKKSILQNISDPVSE